MDRTELLTAGYGSRTQYEREKERLIIEINQGMDTVNRNLLQLNQNLESAISLGSSFGRIASLWNEFGTIINPQADEEGAHAGNSEDSEDGDEHANGADVTDAAASEFTGMDVSEDGHTFGQSNSVDPDLSRMATDTLMDQDS
ncbi:hypothetical protein LPJ66_004543 [Kickxella alabastrina]|uniref:Uncharacterized protein n=1 Tax=Kickxella alabastrina TaxID=61397 RepID=A0ACC1INP0_9FUNG|nr:hypothetical protein LPJ66_004543 [Kickxella alabastrina]